MVINRDQNFRELIHRRNRIKTILLGLESLQKKENDKVQVKQEIKHEMKEEEFDEEIVPVTQQQEELYN